MLQDPFGRQFSYLRLSITDICNYRCNYCLPDGNPCDARHRLTIDHIALIAKTFAAQGISKIRITGGEPSVRHDLPEIISTLKSTKGIETVAMTTNGHRMENYLTDWVRAGLDTLNISCDSLDARKFHAITGKDNLDRLLASIEQAQQSGLKKVKLNTVLLKEYNLNDLQAFINWVRKTGLTLRFIELMETGDNTEYFAANHVSAEQVQRHLLLQGWQQKIRAKNSGPAKEFFHPDHQGSIGFIAPYSKDFCNSCNRLRVSSLGKLHLCLFGESGHDLTPWLDNADEQGLAHYIQDILQSKPEKHYLTEHKTGATKQLAMLGG